MGASEVHHVEPARKRLGSTGLDVFPLALGGNVFGWTATERESFAVLDAYAAAGGNFIDTADLYCSWVPGNSGGESEMIIGKWLAKRRNRSEIVVATKVGMLDSLWGLSSLTINIAIDASLRRLGVDYIDLYYAHLEDPHTPQEETLATFDALVKAGKVRHLGASNFTAPRLREALSLSAAEGWSSYEVVQPAHSLIERSDYEGPLAALCTEFGLPCVPHSALAQGFLTGKYRPGSPASTSPRAGDIHEKYVSSRAHAIVEVVAEIATERDTTLPSVSLAWLMAQSNVVAPIASARSPEQLAALLPSVALELSPAELSRLERAA